MPTFYYSLEGAIVPKARPRNSRCGHSYLPGNYREWKNEAIILLAAQHQGPAFDVPVAISIILTGKHSQRGDGDNVMGSILDVMVQAEILTDDNLKQLPSVSLVLIHSSDPPLARIRVSTELDLQIPDWAEQYF